MKIPVDDIPQQGLVLTLRPTDETLAECLDRMALPDGVSIDPRISGEITVFNDAPNVIALGKIETTVSLTCSRCLDEYGEKKEIEISLVFRKFDEEAGYKEAELDEEDGETVFFQGPELDLAEALAQEIVLAIPMKTLCKEDCPGLCPQCGAPRGSAECTCPSDEAHDPRWEALAQLKKRIEAEGETG